MEDLEKIRALFNSGEESNIKLGLTLCEALPESEPLLQRYREFVGLYPDLFSERPEFWMQIQMVAYTDDVRLSLEHWETCLELFPSAESLTILVETDEAEIHLLEALAAQRPNLRELHIQSTNATPPKIVLHIAAAFNDLSSLREVRFSNVRFGGKLHTLSRLKSLSRVRFFNCDFEEEGRFDWILELKSSFRFWIFSDYGGPEYVEDPIYLMIGYPEIVVPIELLPMFPSPLPYELVCISCCDANPTLSSILPQFPNVRNLRIEARLRLCLDLRNITWALLNLTDLSLCGNTLLKSEVLLPPCFSGLENLTSFRAYNLYQPNGWEALGIISTLGALCLDDCQIEAIPDSWANLPQIQGISLQGNHLQTVPDWLGSLVSLTSLNLVSNRLTSLPESLWARLEEKDPNRSIKLYADDNPFDTETQARLNSI